jgi:hypothetical protein
MKVKWSPNEQLMFCQQQQLLLCVPGDTLRTLRRLTGTQSELRRREES